MAESASSHDHDSSSASEQEHALKGTPKVDFSKPLDTSALKGKTALVTGAASGIGAGIALALAENGVQVALCDVQEAAGKQLEEDLNGKGYKARFILTDTTSWDSQLDAFKQTLSWSDNQLDIVVPAAGQRENDISHSYLPRDHSADADPPEPPTSLLLTNLMGVYLTTSLTLFYFNRLASKKKDPSFKPQILYVASLAAFDAIPFAADYTAAKFGVRGLWKSIRRPNPAHAQYQANLLGPTFVRTPMITPFVDALEKRGTKIAEVSDVVAAGLRCICDPNVDGRAVGVAKSLDGQPGTGNFDFWDDIADFNGGKRLLEMAMNDRYGNLF